MYKHVYRHLLAFIIIETITTLPAYNFLFIYYVFITLEGNT